MDFDARQHLVTLNGSRRITPKLLFEGEVIDAPEDPRISVIVGFPDACTYGLGLSAKLKRDKSCIEAKLRREKAEKEAEANRLRREVEDKRKEIALKQEEVDKLQEEEEEVEEELEQLPESKEGKRPQLEQRLEVRRSERKTIEKTLERDTKALEIVDTHLEGSNEDYYRCTLDEKHFKDLERRQATVFETGNKIHEQARAKTREELLEERKVFLVRDTNDWFQITRKLSEGFTIVCDEFPLYIFYKGLLITGHSDNFVLTPEDLLDLEEWKSSKTGKVDPGHKRQAFLYSLALQKIFKPKRTTYTVKVWNKNDYPLAGRGLLTRLKLGEVLLPPEPSSSYTAVLNGTPKEIGDILNFTYDLFTAQIPCSGVLSGLCKNWCPARSQCPEFRNLRQFVSNFKVEVPNGN